MPDVDDLLEEVLRVQLARLLIKPDPQELGERRVLTKNDKVNKVCVTSEGKNFLCL